MMSLLGPGVRKQQVNAGQRCIRYLVLQHVDGVVRNHPEVFDICPMRLDQAMAYAGLVNLYANEILVRVVDSSQHKRVAVAESNLKSAVSISTKYFA